MEQMAKINSKIEENQSNDEYLSRLPVELWCKILYLAYPTMGSPPCKSPEKFFWTPHNEVYMDKQALISQHMRANLRLICKALESIAVRLLFEELIVWLSPTSIEKLFIAALSRRDGSYYPALSTRTLILRRRGTMKEQEGCKSHLDEIFTVFSNTETLILPSSGIGPRPMKHLDWIRGIKHLFWTIDSVEPENAHGVIARNPQLESLSLHGSPKVDTSSIITLSNLKHLNYRMKNKLITAVPPSVEWLKVEITPENAESIRMVASCRLSYIFIELWAQEDGYLSLDIAFEIIYACPCLKGATIAPFGGIQRPNSRYLTHPSLQAITFVMSYRLFLEWERKQGFRELLWMIPTMKRIRILILSDQVSRKELGWLHRDLMKQATEDTHADMELTVELRDATR